jgi:tRNA-specific 2-thiouridylase
MRVLAVALSGGVDSAVAAALLRRAWPRMVGASHCIRPPSATASRDALERARALCRKLDIPWEAVDLRAEFERCVVDDFVAAFLDGRTPNPCVVCNQAIRFGRFYTELERVLAGRGLLAKGEPLYFATGHYARLEQAGGEWLLRKARDRGKDQSYMLHRLPRAILPRLLFPLGERLKSEVVRMAAELGLGFEQVAESQDACFLDEPYPRFIARRTGNPGLLEPGEIVDPAGRRLGVHRGYLHYTIGQRSGLGLGDGPWYVCRIEPRANRVVVARRGQAARESFAVGSPNWLIPPPREALSCGVKVRYRMEDVPGRVEVGRDGRAWVCLAQPQIVAPGQSAVFYRDDRVLGGGFILPDEGG